ncbi:hypothetical protein ABKV19_022817 [Rosa sericea]
MFSRNRSQLRDQMPGEASSSNSAPCRFSYDVFLSFRGEDTRKTFTDHLYTALVNAGIRTFRDDDEIERGRDIKPELKKAIHRSRSSVVVVSKDYASSRWCLDELVVILQRHADDARGHVVLPVFYDIDPSHVRKQTGSFAAAFPRHRKTQSPEKVKEWREALAQVADLAGMVLQQNQADGYESKFIQKIVKVIGGKLSHTPLSVAPNLIGIHSRVKNISLWLQDGSTDVGTLVIYGISGIGKTTIAKFVYNSNFRRFEGSSFLENIKEISEQPNGLVQIQMQLLSNILNGRKVIIHSVSEGITKIADTINSKRVLLVLDDVDHLDQLDAVLTMHGRFYPGSKIIITTRHLRLLKAQQVTKVHNVETLDYKESLELFSWHAFGQDLPNVHQSGGLPLALKVLGSSLFGESLTVWESALQKLEAIPNSEIMNKLKISYESLQDDHDRKLFLHIACFFIGNDRYNVVRLLDECNLYTTIGIQNLVDRALVTIDGYDKVQMHNVIRDMGRGIVRQESEDPEKCSRLWHYKDSIKVLTEKNGTETIEGLVLNRHIHPANTPSVNSNETILETNAFARMCKLRLLHLSNVQVNGCYKELPTKLRWLCWHAFPLDCIPADFPMANLVVLEMHNSSLTQIWEGTKVCCSTFILLDF